MVKTARGALTRIKGDPRRGVALLRQLHAQFHGWVAIPAALALAALLNAAAPAAAADPAADLTADLTGGYFGLGDARGMRIEIEQGAGDAGPTGRFVDSNGAESGFEGVWKDGAIEAILAFPARDVFLRIYDAPVGLAVIALPISAEGAPEPAQGRELAFLRDGETAPVQPELYQPAPARADGVLDPDVFLASYAFWTPQGVSRGFQAIGARYRTMMRLYPMLHADVLWKLCAAEGGLASDQRGEALRGQGVDCADLSAEVERLQRAGRFADWKAAAEADGADFLAAAQCARRFVVAQSVCGPAAQDTARRAVSLATVASALTQFR